MKVRITFKDPDACYDSVSAAVNVQGRPVGLTDHEWELIREGRVEGTLDALARWISDGEYITVTFDLENHTAVVERTY